MTPAETGYLTLLIDFALTEDLSDDGDVTSRATIPDGVRGEAAFVARSPGVLAGIPSFSICNSQAEVGMVDPSTGGFSRDASFWVVFN